MGRKTAAEKREAEAKRMGRMTDKELEVYKEHKRSLRKLRRQKKKMEADLEVDVECKEGVSRAVQAKRKMAALKMSQATEERKAKLLAESAMTARTHLGLPEEFNLRKMGKYNRLSLTVLERIAQLGFDPLEQSVKIAKGQMLFEDHPFLDTFESVMQGWYEKLESFEDLDIYDIERFKAEGIKALTLSFTPLELRSRHTLELMNYLYPKRKSMEMEVKTNQADMRVTPLTEEEVVIFNAKFKERY